MIDQGKVRAILEEALMNTDVDALVTKQHVQRLLDDITPIVAQGIANEVWG